MIIPDRSSLRTVGDLARVILEDEAVMAAKNIDLATIRELTATGIKK